MREYKTLIQQAELMAMAPGPVVEFLKRRASQSKDEARDDPVDEEVEKALRSRGDPLIDLHRRAVARLRHGTTSPRNRTNENPARRV